MDTSPRRAPGRLDGPPDEADGVHQLDGGHRRGGGHQPGGSHEDVSPAVVVIGVAGAGKTTVGRAVAERLGWAFVDADDLHPAANVAKMHAGRPLDDADRAPWLAAVHRELAEHCRSGTPLVLACSALKASYRAAIAGDLAAVRFVHLAGDPAVIEARMRRRRGHYMPASLLASQLRTFEDDPTVPTVDVDAPVDEVVDRVVRLVAPGPGRRSAAAGDA